LSALLKPLFVQIKTGWFCVGSPGRNRDNSSSDENVPADLFPAKQSYFREAQQVCDDSETLERSQQ